MVELSVKDIAGFVGGRLHGDETLIIKGIAGIEDAESFDLSFLYRRDYYHYFETTQAKAVIVPNDFKTNSTEKTLIYVENPSNSVNQIIGQYFKKNEYSSDCGISEKTFISSNASIGQGVVIEPFCTIKDNCHIGDYAVIQAGSYIGENVKIGQYSHIYPNVSILSNCVIGNRVIIHSGTVIGSDGFGFEPNKGLIPERIHQIGVVVIEDDCDIGANVTVDRARFEKTLIGRGTKIDNLVQIAHNVRTGENCIIVAQTGVAGSATLGDRVILAGQSAIAGHIKIGNDAIVTGRAGVTKSVDEKDMVSGFPAINHRKFKRITASQKKIVDLFEKISSLEKQVHELKSHSLVEGEKA